jgi:hypothetical protein
LLAACALLTPSMAAADAQKCVQLSNDGADLRDAHQMLAARNTYRSCVTEADCPAVVRSECSAALDELGAIIPTLIVALRDEHGHDLLGGTLLLDGKAVALDGSAFEVDPGVHELTAVSGTLRSQLRVLAVEKDTGRRIEIVLQPPKANLASDAPPPPASAPLLLASTVPRSDLPLYALAGVAALGGTSFGYFALTGHSDLRDLDRCKPGCPPSDVSRVRTQYLAADISLGVSLVALAGAGYWLLSTPKETGPAAVPPFSVAVTAGPSVAGLSVRWVE